MTGADAMELASVVGDETRRRREFPVCGERIFLAHAGVAPLPRTAVEAIAEYADRGSTDHQENSWAWEQVGEARTESARLLGCDAREIALLGPTSLGLNLVANGLDWQAGDEVVCYMDDYPANVYPWLKLRDRGVKVVLLQPSVPGRLSWNVIEERLTDRTRLVALASCNFLSGIRLDVNGIGRQLRQRDILFCLDAIQTLGAFPTTVDHVDFLSADSHKWLLGPLGAGILYVKSSRMEQLRPTLLGSWNVVSPGYAAQEEIRFYPGARRYEPGTLNAPGIVGMRAAMALLNAIGIDAVAERILHLRRYLLDAVRPLGFRLYTEAFDLDSATTDRSRSGIMSLVHPQRDLRGCFDALAAAGVTASLRRNRAGADLLRFSPHFYNTEAELDRVVETLKSET